MSLREELENAIRVSSMPIAGWCREGTCTRLIRDHGQALLDALEDADRYRWLRDSPDCEVEVYTPTDKNAAGFGAWHGHSDKDAAIDAAIKGDG